MRAVVQRVSRACVTVSDDEVGRIETGLVALVGVGREDAEGDADLLAGKVVGLRIFADGEGKMNRDVLEAGGAVLAVSQFTLFGDVRKGKRPGFSDAMEPARARALFDRFCAACRTRGALVETGRFGADMQVEMVGDGPVTLLIDTKRAF